MKKFRLKVQWLMVMITLFWSATFPLLHMAVARVGPTSIVFDRFLLASLFMLPLVYKVLNKTSWRIVLFGLILGVLNCGTYLFQTIGLKDLDPSRVAFVTGVSVIMVPFLAPLFRQGFPRLLEIISALVCLGGLFLITGGDLDKFYPGDAWTLGCALCVALTILSVEKMTKHHTQSSDILLLTFYQMAFTAVLMIPVAGTGQLLNGFMHWDAFLPILFCAFFATFLALYIQVRYQHFISASRAALIFMLEPVFASIIDAAVGYTLLTWVFVFGSLLIIGSILLAQLPELKKQLVS